MSGILDSTAQGALDALGPAPGNPLTDDTETSTTTPSTTDTETNTVIVEVAGRQLVVPRCTKGDSKLGESCRPQQLSKKALLGLVQALEKELVTAPARQLPPLRAYEGEGFFGHLAKAKPQAKTKEQPKRVSSKAVPPGQAEIVDWLPEGLKPGGEAANAGAPPEGKVLWDNRSRGTRILGFHTSMEAHWVLKEYALQGKVQVQRRNGPATLWIWGWHVVCDTTSGTCENTPHKTVLRRIGAK